jgi:hypothetical protein
LPESDLYFKPHPSFRNLLSHVQFVSGVLILSPVTPLKIKSYGAFCFLHESIKILCKSPEFPEDAETRAKADQFYSEMESKAEALGGTYSKGSANNQILPEISPEELEGPIDLDFIDERCPAA